MAIDCRKRPGHGQLEVEGDRVELPPMVGICVSAAPMIGSAISVTVGHQQSVLRHRKARDEAEHDQHQRHVHHVEAP